jgi:phage replication O-like protein O
MVADIQVTFPGFQFPNTTQIPNEVFDSLMPHLSGGELKVLLYICRRTFGFRKDSDSISLTQIAHGITTKAGRVLDQGTGLSKRQVQRALRVLENRQVILVERKVDETGLHEVNTYRLNVLSGDKMSPSVETRGSGGVKTPMSPGVETPMSTTKQREQNKERQKKDLVDVVAKDLEIFGIAKSAVTKLTQDYPMHYIREKLLMAQGLVAAGSSLISQNPAGWLRRAIEEDYALPKPSEGHRQRSGRKKKHATLTQAKPREQYTPEEKPYPTQSVATELAQCQQNVVTPNKENNIENKETEKTDWRENQATWDKVVEQLKESQPIEDVEARLTGTILIEVTDSAATIFVPNRFAIPWLERRLYGQIAKAMKSVVGKDVDLQFIAAS